MRKVKASKEEVTKLYKELKNLGKVGELFGVSGERIRQIVSGVDERRPKKAKWWQREDIDLTAPSKEIAKKVGLTYCAVLARKKKLGIKRKSVLEQRSNLDFTKSNDQLVKETGLSISQITYARRNLAPRKNKKVKNNA